MAPGDLILQTVAMVIFATFALAALAVDLELAHYSLAAGWLGGKERSTLFLLVAEWQGSEALTSGSRTGQVLTASAPAPGGRWP